jgi:hypothetical protein
LVPTLPLLGRHNKEPGNYSNYISEKGREKAEDEVESKETPKKPYTTFCQL